MDTKSPTDSSLESNSDKETIAPLTPEEQARIIEGWNVKKFTRLKDLVEYAIGPGFDGRSGRGMLVKKFLAERDQKAVPANIKDIKSYTLTPQDEEFITNNAKYYNSYILLARELFQNDKLTPLYAEADAVRVFYEALPEDLKPKNLDDAGDPYRPPRSEREAITRINTYVDNQLTKSDGDKIRPLNKEELSPRQIDCVSKLIKFASTHRFVCEMDIIKKKSERKLFESTFVRMVWDKPDLTEEEVELYINLCSDVLAAQRMEEEVQEMIDFKNDEISQNGKIPMPVVEMIGKLRHDLSENKKRQKQTLNDLNGKRSERLKDIKGNGINVLSLVEAFREKKVRDQLLKIAEVRKNKVMAEKERLETMDDLMIQIYGLSDEEVFI